MFVRTLLCCRVDARDPCSRRCSTRRSTRVSVGAEISETVGRRDFLKRVGASLLLPAAAKVLLPSEAWAGDFVSQGVDPAQLWDGERLRVFAYKQGAELGELCRRLDDVKAELPVSLIWRLPPDWANVFPTIHFEVSSRQWKKYEGWQTPEHFVDFYARYNPPPRSANQPSPFQQYAASYDGPKWSYPGEIDTHLTDPESLHRFSKFELRGLSKQDMENLHAAHHEEHIEPGLRPALPPALANHKQVG